MKKKLPLQYPIEIKGTLTEEVQVRRPTARDIADGILLLGGERVAAMIKTVMEKEGELTVEVLKSSGLLGELIMNLSSLISQETADQFFTLVARLCGLSKEDAEQLSPEDLGAVGQKVADFFPQLFGDEPSTGDPS